MNDADAGIAVEGLARSFGGVRALDGLDVTIPWGQVTALVGPNGAGKTTLLLILAGLLAPDAGRVRVAGVDPVTDPFEVHRVVGWMPDQFGVYDGLTAREYLELFGAAYRMPRAERAQRARELLALVELEELTDRQIGGLSRGQKQRLGFARTIVHEPRVLLLDEPASGLDPRARLTLRELLLRERDAGACVLVSSHVLAELEEMSDAAVFMERGRRSGDYSVEDASHPSASRPWRLRALDPDALQVALKRAGVEPRRGRDGSISVDLSGDEAAADLVAQLVRDGVRVAEAAPESGSLERAFLASETEAGNE